MTTFQELVADTRNLLMTNQSERITQLLSGINDIVTTLTLKFDAPQITEGFILGIDFEEFYVVSKSGTSVTVIRGFNGSVPASHDADAVIRIAAKFTDFKLSKYVNDAIEDLSADGLFWIDSTDFQFSPSRSAYNLNTPNLIDIWRVRYEVPGPHKNWYDIRKCDWHLDPAADLTDFPNGKSLLIQQGGFPGKKIRVSFKSSFLPLALPADDVETVAKVHKEAHKLISYGAAIISLGGREVKRTFTENQPEPRRAQEVPAGAMMQSMRPLVQFYVDTLSRERKRLRRKYPDQVY